jgi:hypothetical protein
MPPADPVLAGRKGGKSKSAKKLAAARRNGFQPHEYDQKRVDEARRTGIFEGLRCDEAVAALSIDGKPPTDEAPASVASVEDDIVEAPATEVNPTKALYFTPEPLPVSGIKFNPIGDPEDGTPADGQ